MSSHPRDTSNRSADSVEDLPIEHHVNLSAQGDIIGRDSVHGDKVLGNKILHYGDVGVPPIRSPRPSDGRGRLRNVPSLPPHHIPRSNVFGRSKQALISNTSPQDDRVRHVALVGMAGAGKSVLARALARDEDVRQTYPDGVVWLEFGKQPDLRTRQAQLGATLGDVMRAFHDTQQGLAHLNRLLEGGSCLIVLDDVWQLEHLRPFDLDERNCALLITTRSSAALHHDAIICPVDLLDEDAAVLLLAAWGSQSASSLPPDAYEVARLCGGLPLALSIAGGMAQGRPDRWAKVLHRLQHAELKKLKARFRGYPYPDLLRALDTSVADLLPQERDRYIDLAVFEHLGEIPLEVVKRWWRHADLQEYDSDDLLETLAIRSLVQINEAAGSLSLHDLQFDYIRGEISRERLRQLHASLALVYLTDWGGLDASLPRLREMATTSVVTRFALTTLVAHMLHANTDMDLHRLLAVQWDTDLSSDSNRGVVNAWHAAHEQAFGTGTYSSDIMRAWRQAEVLTDKAIASGEPAWSIGLEIRYALVSASLISIAANAPLPILIALVKSGKWTAERALSFARQIPRPNEKVQALAELLPHLAEESKTTLAEALAVAQSVDGRIERAKALAQLVPHLSNPEREIVVGQVLKHLREPRAWNDDGHASSSVLETVAPHLSPSQLDEALTIHNGFTTSSFEKADTLIRMAVRVPKYLCGKVLASIQALEDSLSRLWGLIFATVELDDPHRKALIAAEPVSGEVLADVWELTHWSPEVGDLLYPLGHPEMDALIATAKETALAEDAPVRRVWGLLRLASHISASERRALLDEVLALPPMVEQAVGFPSWPKASMLMALMPHLPESDHPMVVDKALDYLRQVQGTTGQIIGFNEVAPYLSERQFILALDIIREIPDRIARMHSLTGLAGYLPDDLLAEGLAVVYEIGDVASRIKGLLGCLPYLPMSDRAHFLTSALQDTPNLRAFWDVANIARLLGRLVTDLPQPEQEAALSASLALARSFEDPESRGRVLAAVAPFLPASDHLAVCAEALDAIREAQGDSLTWTFFSELAPHMPESLFEEALPVALALQDEHCRSDALQALIPYLPGKLAQDGIAAAQEHMATQDQIYAVAALVPHLTGANRRAVVAELLNTARTYFRETGWTKPLLAVVQHLSTSQRSEVLNEALEHARAEEHSSRAYGLMEIAVHLPTSEQMAVLREALDAARQEQDPNTLANLLCALVPDLPADERAAVLAEALNAVRGRWDGIERAKQLTALATYLPESERAALMAESLEGIVEKLGWSPTEEVLWDLLQGTAEHDSPSWIPHWRPFLRATAMQGRPDVFSDPIVTGAVAFLTGGEGASQAAAQAIVDVSRWWP